MATDDNDTKPVVSRTPMLIMTARGWINVCTSQAIKDETGYDDENILYPGMTRVLGRSTFEYVCPHCKELARVRDCNIIANISGNYTDREGDVAGLFHKDEDGWWVDCGGCGGRWAPEMVTLAVSTAISNKMYANMPVHRYY